MLPLKCCCTVSSKRSCWAMAVFVTGHSSQPRAGSSGPTYPCSWMTRSQMCQKRWSCVLMAPLCGPSSLHSPPPPVCFQHLSTPPRPPRTVTRGPEMRLTFRPSLPPPGMCPFYCRGLPVLVPLATKLSEQNPACCLLHGDSLWSLGQGAHLKA